MDKNNIGIIILAAGKGTRMNSDIPKVCFELAGKSLIEHVLETSLSLNPDIVGVVVGYKKEDVIEKVKKLTDLHKNIFFVNQENQNGTGDAVKSAKNIFENFQGCVFVLCGDVPLLTKNTLVTMLNTHNENNAQCTVLTMILENPDKYGRILRDNEGRIKEIIEFKDATPEIRNINEVNTGIYCFNCKDLFYALEYLDSNNAQNEFYLTDVVKIMYNNMLNTISIVLQDHKQATGINTQEQLLELAVGNAIHL